MPISFHSLGAWKTAQTQQDTVFEILTPVSPDETMFHLRAKLRALKQFVSATRRQKGAHTFYAPLVEIKVPL
jgi:hypothetical protein